ncbi:MAG: hypothetical protein ACRD2E_09725 [Terriglobales bacterium]
MKKLVALAALLASLSLVAVAANVTLRGKVGDSMCGAKNTSVACVNKCFKMGDAPVLVSHGHVYAISNPKVLENLGGRDVVVRGNLHHGVLTVAHVHVLHHHASAGGR